jgi:lysophospholipase L1-like esterase
VRTASPRRRLGLALSLALGGTLAGSAVPPSAPAVLTPVDLSVAAGATEVRSYVAVGDSITAGAGPGDRLEFPGPTGWVSGETAERLVGRGGWAVAGAITADMVSNVGRTPADVLVLLGGTNDLTRGIDWETTAANLATISTSVGARSTLLVAIPPNDALGQGQRADFNARLAALAGRQGWRFLDPWGSIAVDGRWQVGASADGIHPTPLMAQAIGRAISDATWTAAARRTGR